MGGKGRKPNSTEDCPTPPKLLAEEGVTPVGRMPLSSVFSPAQKQLEATATSSPTPFPRSSLFGPKVFQPISISEIKVGNCQSQITGRISLVSDLRLWSNNNGSGKIRSFQIIDQSGEVSVVLFNQIVDQFEHLLLVNSVVEVKGFRAKLIDAKYQSIPDQKLELALNNDGSIVPAVSHSAPDIPFNFMGLDQIFQKKSGSVVDLYGIIHSDLGIVQGTKDGHQWNLRNLAITDKSKGDFQLKIWGKRGEEFTMIGDDYVPFAVRRAKYEIFDNSHSIVVENSTLLWLNPPMPETQSMLDLIKHVLQKQTSETT